MAAPQQKAAIVNIDSDGNEVIAYPQLDGNEANVVTSSSKAEITIPAGSKVMFATPLGDDCVLKGGNTPVTIGAGEGYVVAKNTTIPFKLSSDINTVAYKSNTETGGSLSYTFE